jgi:hypothetical protein
MPLERDHIAERLARIDSLLTEVKRTSTPVVADRTVARHLTAQLDEMLKELAVT